MATYKQGILGGFKGKVGTVIGSFWKGRNVMRAVPNHVNDPQTPAQMAQRQKFSLVSHFVNSVFGFVKVGYGNYAATETEANAAVRDNLANAVVVSGESISLDLDRVQLSKGSLLNVESPACTAGTSHSVNVSWTDNTGAAAEALGTDSVMVCLFDQAKSASTYDTTSATRADAALTVHYPSGWAGDTVTVFIATRNADTSICSNSAKVGTVTAS